MDDQGHRYIDTGMWHSRCNFGYRNPQIENALADQVRRLPQVSGDFLHREKLCVAEHVVDAIYDGTGVKGRVSFKVGCSLAVEDALKIVRKHTGRNRVATFMGSYHGRSLGTLALSSSHRYRQFYGEFSDRAAMFPFADCPHCYYQMKPATCDIYCSKMVRKAFSNPFYGLANSDHCELGALIVEPCQGRGYTISPRDFFHSIVNEVRSHGLLVISDEIQAGMYRTGRLFSFEHFGFVSDIVTLSKSLTNGLSPVSMTWARAELVDPSVFTPGHAHSNFANHPLGTAAALATWEYMMAQDYPESVPRKGELFLAELQRLADRHASVYSVAGLGLMLNIVLADPQGRPHANAATRAATIAQNHDFLWAGERWRMILQVGGFESHVLKLAPYLDITETEIERSLTVLDQVLGRLDNELETQGSSRP